MRSWTVPRAAMVMALCLWSATAVAHDVAEGDKAFVLATDGPAILPFLYLGAKHRADTAFLDMPRETE